MNSYCKVILLILGITIVKLVLSFFLPIPVGVYEEHDIAVNLIDTGEAYYINDGIKKYAYSYSFFPYILYVLYKIWGINTHAAVMLNIILMSIIGLIIYRFFSMYQKYFLSQNEWKNYIISLLVVLIVLIHPGLNYYAFFKVHPLIAEMFFLFLSLYMMMMYLTKSSSFYLIVFSVVIGISCLMRTTIITVLFPFLLFLLQRHSFSEALRIFFLPLILCLMFLGLWVSRNYYKEGVMSITSETGKILWKGIIHGSEGSNYIDDKKIFYSALTKEEYKTLPTLTAKEQNDFFMRKYWEQVKKKPFHVLKMYGAKLRNFWLFRPYFGNELPAPLKRFILFYKIGYLIGLFFVLVSIFLYGKRIMLLLSLPIALSCMQAIFYAETRHRLIVEPIMIFSALMVLFDFFSRMLSNQQSFQQRIID